MGKYTNTMKVKKLTNILDYHRLDIMANYKAYFAGYDKGDDCLFYTVKDKNNIEVLEVVIYGYKDSFFYEENFIDLLISEYDSISLFEHYHIPGYIYVFENETNT